MEKSDKSNAYFITGGAGFIGSHLVERLLSENNSRITVYDNLVSGKRENIAHNLGNGNFEFIVADLLDYNTLTRAMRGHEIIWHLGANTDIPGGNTVTDLDLKNCTTATRKSAWCTVIRIAVFRASTPKNNSLTGHGGTAVKKTTRL